MDSELVETEVSAEEQKANEDFDAIQGTEPHKKNLAKSASDKLSKIKK